MMRIPRIVAFAAGWLAASTLLYALGACSALEKARFHPGPVFHASSLDGESLRELERFYSLLDEYSNDNADVSSRQHFRDAFRHVRANYVRAVDKTAMIDAAIKGVTKSGPRAHGENPDELVETALAAMVSSLDPHSQYLSDEELKERKVFASGEFGGLGIQVTMEEGLVKVISPIEGTPADRAGIVSGDLITHINAAPVMGMELADAVKKMRGPVGTTIRITVLRAGRDAFDVAITREIIQVRSVRWEVKDNTGYIRISSFSEQTAPGLVDAFDEIAKAAGANLRGYVLDLRSNPGGLLDQAVFVSDMFLDDGEIVSVRPRNIDYLRSYSARHGDLAGGLPVVVLVNEGSASASEIVAGALKDNARALIMGRRSFGKGSVQTIRELPVRGALQLTTALYYFPSGKSIQALGVLPDIVLDRPIRPAGDDATTGDEVAGDGAAPVKVVRESDLPGALGGVNGDGGHEIAHLETLKCPPVGNAGGDGDGDRELGCAIAYLGADSLSGFISAYSRQR